MLYSLWRDILFRSHSKYIFAHSSEHNKKCCSRRAEVGKCDTSREHLAWEPLECEFLFDEPKSCNTRETFLSGVFCMGASKDAAFHASLDFLTPTLSHLLTKRDMPATLFKRRHAEKMFTQENLKFPHFSPERVSRHFFHTLIQFEVVLSASAYTFYNNTVARFRSLFSLKFSI